MSPLAVMALVLGFVALDVVVVGAVISAVARQVADALEPYPLMPASEPSVKRTFQGLSFGLMNLGGSFELEVDEVFLHVRPLKLGRILRIPAASIPWPALSCIRLGRFGAKARLGRTTVGLPAWTIREARQRGWLAAAEPTPPVKTHGEETWS